MAPRIGFGRKKRTPPPLDELGGLADGGLAILDQDTRLIHMTPARVASAMRYFLARVQLHDAQGMPERLALTSALLGEGVTYVTRSLAAVIAYDTEASVVIVDLTFRRPDAPRRASKSSRRSSAAGAQPVGDGSGAAQPPADVPSDHEPGSGAAQPSADVPSEHEPEAVDEGTDQGADETAAAADDPVPPITVPAAGDGDKVQLTLADAIEHGAALDDILIPTSNPRLCVIQAGRVPVARRPALAQGRPLATLLDQLDERFDHVLLDLPPVLASSDAMNLSQLADAFVLVVQQGVTTESQVEAALQELHGSETLGLILNRFDSNIPRRLRRLVGT